MKRVSDLIASLSRGNLLLVGLVFVQLLLGGVLFWQSNQQANFEPPEMIVEIDQDSVDDIQLDDGETTLSLVRNDGAWNIGGDAALAVDASKLETALSSLTSLSVGLPVATQESSQKQLEVADEDYQRRVLIKAGGKEQARLFVGTSPGFRKSHIRLADSKAIYAGSINVFDLPVSADDWLDKSLLQFDSVDGLAGQGYSLMKTDDQWTIAEPEDKRSGYSVNEDVLQEVLAELKSLRVLGVAQDAASELEDSANEESQTVTFSVRLAENLVDLTLEKRGESISIERSDRAGRFSVSASVFDTLAKTNEEQLLVSEPAADSQGVDSDVDQPAGESDWAESDVNQPAGESDGAKSDVNQPAGESDGAKSDVNQPAGESDGAKSDVNQPAEIDEAS